MPNAASMANITLFRRSIVLHKCFILEFDEGEIKDQIDSYLLN